MKITLAVQQLQQLNVNDTTLSTGVFLENVDCKNPYPYVKGVFFVCVIAFHVHSHPSMKLLQQ
jgi:hypothetical protein